MGWPLGERSAYIASRALKSSAETMCSVTVALPGRWLVYEVRANSHAPGTDSVAPGARNRLDLQLPLKYHDASPGRPTGMPMSGGFAVRSIGSVMLSRYPAYTSIERL